MLGQHPQLYAIPEAHLFVAETLQEWWDTCAKTSFNMSHGLVRAVSELFYGEQNETTVQLAHAWLRRRLPFTSGYIIELLAERVYPRALVEKSPSMIFHLESMQRVARTFPLDASTTARILDVPTGSVTRAEGDVHPQGNPHYWLDPENGKITAREIFDKLAQFRPNDRPYFEQRLKPSLLLFATRYLHRPGTTQPADADRSPVLPGTHRY